MLHSITMVISRMFFPLSPGGIPRVPRKNNPLFKDGPQLKIVPLGCPDCDCDFSDEEAIMEHMGRPPHNFVAPSETEGGGGADGNGKEEEEDEEEVETNSETLSGRSSSAAVIKQEALEEEEEERLDGEKQVTPMATVEEGKEIMSVDIAEENESQEEEREEEEEKPRLKAVVEGGEIKIRPEKEQLERVDVKKEPQGFGTIMCPVLTCNKLLTTTARLVQHLRAGKHNQPCPSCGKVFPRVR